MSFKEELKAAGTELGLDVKKVTVTRGEKDTEIYVKAEIDGRTLDSTFTFSRQVLKESDATALMRIIRSAFRNFLTDADN